MNTALAEAAGAAVDAAFPEQVELHELLGLPGDVVRTIEQRRGGRPAGARNKRLAEASRLVREHLGDVLLSQVAVAVMPVDQLIALGLKPAEAVAEKRLSAATVLPYLEQKQPLRVDMSGKPPVFLTIEMGTAQGQQYQGVAGAALVQLDGAELDGSANPLFSFGIADDGQLIADQAGASAPSADGQAGAAPADRVATPGGAVSGPPLLSRAPVGVVPPRSGNSDPTRNQVPAEPGAGERLP